MKVGKLFSRRGGYVVGLAVASVVGGLVSAIALAAIPDSGGLIHGCYKTTTGANSGSLRVIDSATQTCASGEAGLNWSQNGSGGSGGFVSNLVGADFSSGDIRYQKLSGRDLSNANLTSAKISGADLSGANLTGATLASVVAHSTNFVSANFTGAQMQSGDFRGSDFTGDDLSGRSYQSTEFGKANLTTVNFSNSQFDNVNFYDPFLPTGTGANLAGANFTGSSFNVAIFYGADLTTANLTGTTWVNTVCPDGTNSDSNGSTCLGHLLP